MDRPYRIPLPDWAAVLLVIPPTIATVTVLLISNWYVYIFTFGAVIAGLLMFKLGEISKRRGWFTYEVKAKVNQYSMPPIIADDSTTFTGTASYPSSAVANEDECEWEYGEENKIT